MTLRDRLAAIVQALPESSAVTLPVSELRQWLVDEPVAMSTPTEKQASTADRWLSAQDVAERLGVGKRYVYAHRRSFPFTKELPGGAVRFSERGLQKWMERHAA